jgi:hypothetical protein
MSAETETTQAPCFYIGPGGEIVGPAGVVFARVNVMDLNPETALEVARCLQAALSSSGIRQKLLTRG